MKKNKPLLYDPLIINRVKQYLEENVDKTYLDVGVMSKQLQERYPEYSRRKIAPFRGLVEQAYRIVSQSYGMDAFPSSNDDSDGSDLEVMEESNSNNVLKNIMNNMYSKSKGNASNSSSTKATGEAIDISSDESGDESETPNGKRKSKASASSSAPNLNLREVTLTKTAPAPQENSSKNAGNATANSSIDVTPAASAAHGQKRSDYNAGLAAVAGAGAQPTKKHKTDAALPSMPRNSLQQQQQHALQQQQQQQQLQHQQQQYINQQHQRMQQMSRMSNYNQNSHDSFPPVMHHTSSSSSRPRKFKKEVQLRKSRETFQDIGGMEKTLKELCELLLHIKSPDIYFVLGLMPPRGILLHGPSGCGKTLLAHAIAGQLNLPLIEIPATELIAGVSGESEERIRDVFEQASACAPCVLFIDEIDAISSNRTMAQKDMERRIVSQLISSLDNLKLSEGGQSVLVIGATTRPDVLDPALRRVGRFDHEISIGIPTRKDRKEILNIICEGLSVEQKCDFDKVAELTPGYVGADLLALVSRAATIAVKRKCSEQMRAFQAKTQRNITIVDLDDDADENAESASKKAEDNTEADKAEKLAANDEANKSEDEKKQTNVTPSKKKTSTADSDKEQAEAMEVEDAENEQTNGKAEADAEDEAQNKDKADANNSEKEEESAAENNESLSTDNLNIPEPSLFELLNWLDNPPEDITFVADFSITLDDFIDAVKVVQPSAKREGFITVPDVTWDDVGSMHDIREELKLAVLAPVKFPEKLERLGLSAPSGVLLCGPPGCGKTLLAKAIANEAGINFISVKGPELMNMYVGESERAVRACFQRARNSAPCVIFFDEFDSLCPKRSDTNEGGSGTRVVNQLLTEMDGVEDRKGVYILAATNRPDIIDPAILRPGRLDTILYVGLPEHDDRIEILKATTKNGTKPVLSSDVDLIELAMQTDGYTGADLAGLVRQASMLALKQAINSETEVSLDDMCVSAEHFEQAIQMLRPSVSAQDRKVYEKLRQKYAAPRIPAVSSDAD